MSRGEWRRIGVARRDPAVSFLMLLPLALIHLSGRGKIDPGAFAIIERGFMRLGAWSGWLLTFALASGVFWATHRIQRLRIPWRGGAMLMGLEGFCDSRNSSWAMIREAISSWTGPTRQMMRSLRRRE